MEHKPEYADNDQTIFRKPKDRDFKTEKRFFPGYEADREEGVSDARPNCWYLHLDTMIVGSPPDEMIAVMDNAGDIVEWEELQAIIEAVRPFYERVPADEITRYNNRPRTIYRGPQSHERATKPKTHPGHVYLLQCGPHYKIGISAQINERIKQLSTQPPFDVELLHAIYTDDMYGLEKQLHDRYTDKRKNGEWFELDQDDVEYIKGLN